MLRYIILGILQGIFEWIPISSEGIISLTSNFLITDINPVDVAIFLHLGTLLAVLVYFRKDWIELFTFKNKQMFQFITLTTVISLALGYPLYKLISNVSTGASLLLLTGVGLLLTAYTHRKKINFNLKLNHLAIISGITQGLAVIPGLSRSGSTIFGLSLGKLEPEDILKLSYMMSVPAIAASTFYLALKEPLLIETWPALVSSFIVGLLSLSFVMKISKKINFFWFALIFAILCILGGILGFII